MKQGDILIAIDPCIMNESKRHALTVGKKYEIQITKDNEFCIMDNQGDPHWFTLEGESVWTKWFRLVLTEEEIY